MTVKVITTVVSVALVTRYDIVESCSRLWLYNASNSMLLQWKVEIN